MALMEKPSGPGSACQAGVSGMRGSAAASAAAVTVKSARAAHDNTRIRVFILDLPGSVVAASAETAAARQLAAETRFANDPAAVG